jgi:hypothetical protein
MSHNICSDKFTQSELVSGNTTDMCEVCGGAVKRGASRFCGSGCYSAWRKRTSAASTVDRFWSKVKVGGPHECWLWTGSRIPSWHGQMYLNGRPQYVHRISWEWAHGPIADGMQVLHRCDVPICVNPAHLFLGDQVANLKDAAAKGRFHVPRPRSQKLSPEQLKDIDALLDAGELQVRIAERYGVSESWVSQYAKGLRRQYDRPARARRRSVA